MRSWSMPALAFALMAFGSQQSLAAGTATIDSGGELSRISWQDARTLRIDPPDKNVYMVLQDGKAYVVNTRATQGVPQVMEIGDMVQTLSAMGGMAGVNDAVSAALSQRVDAVRKLGQKETVAGIAGEVYEVTVVDDQGSTTTQRAVLTDDPLVVEMTDAYLAFADALVGADRTAGFKAGLPKGFHGLLRVGDDMVVRSIGTDAPAPDSFELPAAPVNLGDMMQQMMKRMPGFTPGG